MTTELKLDELGRGPCPFCGGAFLARYGWGEDRWYVKCFDCAAAGPEAPAKDEAIAAWNRRATDGQRDTARGVPEGWTVERRENGDILIQSPTGDRAGVWHDDTSPLAEVVRQLFQDMMYAAPTPPDGGIPTDTIDRLTRQKAAHIIARDGFQVSGVVLTKPNGSVCIVDKSAVRWLTGDELFRVMHPDAQPDGDVEHDFDPLDFGAELYRAHAMKVLSEVEAIAKDRTDAHWAGFQNAIEEVRHRLEPAAIAGSAIDAAMAASKGSGHG